MADIAPVKRIVPGAPPPPSLSKSQKKKRKSVIKPRVADALSAESILAIPDSKANSVEEKLPEEVDVKKDAVEEAAEAAPLVPVQEVVQDKDKSKKASPAVELLNKRIKVQTKKLSRIAVYSSKPPSELNEDQRKSVATLPSIQGAVRELEETRKAIETLEAEEAKERAKQREEKEKATNDRIATAISDASIAHEQRLSEILSLLRVSSLLSASNPTTFALAIDEKERHALYATADTLLGPECPKKEEIASGLLFGQGDMDGIAYTRLLEVVNTHRNPPLERDPTPTPEEAMPQEDVQPPIVEEVISSTVAVESPPLAPEGVVPASSGGSFHFMQESELEAASFEHGAEWVEKPQDSPETAVIPPEVEAPAGLTIIDTGIPLDVDGAPKHLDEPPLSAVSAALDWAADDGDGLPSINSLHAKFGTSGAATPEALPQDATPVAEVSQVPEQRESPDATPTVNGDANAVTPHGTTARDNTQVDEDGFVVAKNSRGRQSDSRSELRGSERGRGRSGFRGDRGGEYRGGYRGRGGTDSFGSGWRGGDGEFRGRGGYRGDRGRGGDFRGRGGDFRGRGGDFRGRGRGERGYRGGRGSFDGNGDQGEKQAQS